MTDRITSILEDEPQKTGVKIDSPDYNPSDFDKSPEEPIEQSEETPSREPDGSQDNEEPGASSGVSEEEGTKEEEKEETEQERQVNEIKSEVAKKLLDPETTIAMADMLLCRAGTIGNRSKKEDWRLDDDEKEIFAKLMSATMEEEGMEFWPAKYWILIAVVMIYGFKGIDVWDQYYSAEGEKKHDPIQKRAAEKKATDETRNKVKKELEELSDLVEMERKKKELLDELKIMTQPSDNGAPDEEQTEETPTEEATAVDVTEETQPAKEVSSNSEEEEEKPPEQINPDEWRNYRHRYDETGKLMRNKVDGKPKKRPGMKPGVHWPRNKQGHFLAKE